MNDLSNFYRNMLENAWLSSILLLITVALWLLIFRRVEVAKK